MLKVSILGAGFIGAQHASAYRLIDGVELVAVVDLNKEAGEKLALEFDCKYFSDAETMLKEIKPDIVDVCLPTFLHEKFVKLAFEYGAHVLCEKPFALSYKSAEAMVKAAEKADRTLMVGQSMRFWPEYVKAKELLDNGEIGPIRMVSMSRLGEHPNWSTWHRDPNKSGGALYDLHIHDIDYACFAFGDVDTIYAIGEKNEDGCWNHLLTTLTFKNGTRAAVEGSFAMTENYPFTMTMRIVGHDATFEYNFSAGFNIEDVGGAQRSTILYKNGKNPELLEISEDDAFLLELKYFVGQVSKGLPVDMVSPYHSLYVMKVVEGIQESLEKGTIVKI